MFLSVDCCSLPPCFRWYPCVTLLFKCQHDPPMICVMCLNTRRTHPDFRSWFSHGDSERADGSRKSWNSRLHGYVEDPFSEPCTFCLGAQVLRTQRHSAHLESVSSEAQVVFEVVPTAWERGGVLPSAPLLGGTGPEMSRAP